MSLLMITKLSSIRDLSISIPAIGPDERTPRSDYIIIYHNQRVLNGGALEQIIHNEQRGGHLCTAEVETRFSSCDIQYG